MATEADRKAAFLIMQLAEQGRFQEVLAQMIASYEIAADVSFQDMCQLFSEVFGRIVELNDIQGQIWPGLLPGPPDNGPRFEVIHGDHIVSRVQLHRVIDILGSDTTDEKRLLCVFSYLVSEGLISDAGFVTGTPKTPSTDQYDYMVSIIVHPDVRHDETTNLIDEGEEIASESVLNLANYVVGRIDRIDKIGRRPAEELAAHITHIESNEDYIMTWDQARAIQILGEAEERLGAISFEGDLGWEEMYQSISDMMALAGREYVG